MAEKHLRKCSTSLAIREMRIKTTLRFHLTLVIMAKIKNSGACEDVEKEKHSFIDGGITGIPTVEISLVVPQKIENSTT